MAREPRTESLGKDFERPSPTAGLSTMDSTIDLNGTWKDCERHVEQLTQLVRQASYARYPSAAMFVTAKSLTRLARYRS